MKSSSDRTKTEAEIQCVSNDQFRIANNNPSILPVSTFANCTNYNQGGVLETANNCGLGTGVIIKVGFFINPLIELYRVCYNLRITSPIYTIHYIHGQSRKMDGNRYSNWKKDGIDGTVLNMDSVYSNQVTRLNEIFGSPNHDYKEQLDRGHLAAYADFSMQSWQHASNFYINAFPQWHSINDGNWKKVEEMVREHAKNVKQTFKVITGTHDDLFLSQRKIDLFLGSTANQNRVPVPAFAWKILYDETQKQAIGFITLNNPYVKPDVKVVFPCRQNSICANYGWNSQSFENSRLHYLLLNF